jgi:hypothetical protein
MSLYVHAAWNVVGHSRTLWYLNEDGVGAIPLHYDVERKDRLVTVGAMAGQALRHLQLPHDQHLFVAKYTPTADFGVAKPASIDIVVVARSNKQAQQWATLMPRGLFQPRWLTLNMLESFNSNMLSQVPFNLEHSDTIVKYIEARQLSPLWCYTPPIYEVESAGDSWPTIKAHGIYAAVRGNRQPDISASHHGRLALVGKVCDAHCRAGILVPSDWVTLHATHAPAAKKPKLLVDLSGEDDAAAVPAKASVIAALAPGHAMTTVEVKVEPTANGQVQELKAGFFDQDEPTVAHPPPPPSVLKAQPRVAPTVDSYGERYHPLHPVQCELSGAVSAIATTFGGNFERAHGPGAPLLGAALDRLDNDLLMLQTRMQVTKRNVAGFKPAKSGSSALHKVHTKTLAKATAKLDSTVSAAMKDYDVKQSGLSVWTARAALSSSLKLANRLVAAGSARMHFNGQAHSPRMQDDVDAGIDLVFSALNHMRVLSHTVGVVSVQGAGKSSLIRALLGLTRFTVLLEQHEKFMPQLTLLLQAMQGGASANVQAACNAAEHAIFDARHHAEDITKEYVLERLPACCLIFGFVNFKNGHLTKNDFFALVKRVVNEGFLPGQIWFLAEDPVTCKQRLQQRADATLDPVVKAQHQAEADSPIEYLSDLFAAHQLFYATNSQLAARVVVISEKLPVRTDLNEYETLLRRVYGGRAAEYFDSVSVKATLGIFDTHATAAAAAAAP